MALISDIINDVITEISQVPGIATQIYSAARIQQFVQDAILLELEEMWWPNLMVHLTGTLDGITGLLTADLIGPISAITEYGDIAAVFPADINRRIRQLPPMMNPFTLTGATSIYMSPDATFPNRPLKIWPVNSSGDIVVWARQRPPIPISTTDTAYIDRLLLTYDAAWMYCADDGTVPGQVDKFNKLAMKRRDQVKSSFSNQPLQLDPRFVAENDQWWELS